MFRLASLDQLALADEVHRRQQEIQEEERRIREDEEISQVLSRGLLYGPKTISPPPPDDISLLCVKVSPAVDAGGREGSAAGKVKKLSECEEQEGSQSVKFTCRGVEQELVRQVFLFHNYVLQFQRLKFNYKSIPPPTLRK
jgi:hypothetical protein